VSDFVLDACVALAWVLDQPVPAYALEVREELRKGKRGLVPMLWHLEIANGLAMAERRKDLSSADVDAALREMELTARSGLDTDPSPISMGEALSGARGHQLTAYDAVYLELAKRQSLPLATLERSLESAAKKAGVPLL
jgi:predicted nucleic acid-binding protein